MSLARESYINRRIRHLESDLESAQETLNQINYELDDLQMTNDGSGARAEQLEARVDELETLIADVFLGVHSEEELFEAVGCR